MTITYTKRLEDWQDPAKPVRSGDPFEWSDVDLAPIHYAGVANTPDGDPTDGTVEGWLRNTQAWSLREKGYSLYYSVAVDWRGWSWEIRGERYECAANSYVNSRSFALILLTDGQTAATTAQVAETNRLLGQANKSAPRGVTVLGHYQTTVRPYRDSLTPNTDCPGTGIKAQLAGGAIRIPDVVDPPPPPPPPDGTLLAHGWYRVNAGEGPWSVAAKIWGDGRRHPELTARNPGVWHPGQFIEIPDLPTVVVTVRTGEGPYTIIRRAWEGANPQERLAAFYAFNGGEARVLKSGDVVSIPVFWTPR